MINPFLKPAEKPAETLSMGVPVDGSFVCMACDEQVDEAEYFPVEKILVWVCSKEHKSAIENFNLGA